MQIARQESERKPRLAWRRDRAGWLLLAGRRRVGGVVPDQTYPGMWRAMLPSGRPSDMVNLSRAKSAVLDAAIREIEWQARVSRQAAIAPPKSQENGAVFEGSASPMRSRNVAATTPAVTA
jgi:hypothetical protein